MDEQVKIITAWLGNGSINIFGRPFSGKDTQGNNLAELLGGIMISSGQILRSHQDPGAVERVLSSGGIVPSDYYESTVLPYLSRPELAGKPLMLSSVGRSHGEETPTMNAAAVSGHPIKAVINLEFPEAEVWRRFEAAKAKGDRGARDDDNRESLRTRLEKFSQLTVPVIGFYKDRGLLIEVDGTPPPDKVTEEIVQALADRSKR